VTLQTSGIQQLGWATLRCQFTQEEGVGDTPDSYAYDGKRCRKWHVRSGEYGDAWAAGDVVSICLDLEAREVCAVQLLLEASHFHFFVCLYTSCQTNWH
jgi:Kip1 ubiquitination-promoting complex protein 1